MPKELQIPTGPCVAANDFQFKGNAERGLLRTLSPFEREMAQELFRQSKGRKLLGIAAACNHDMKCSQANFEEADRIEALLTRLGCTFTD